SSLSSLPRPPSRDIPRKQHPLENYARLAYDIAVALEEHADIGVSSFFVRNCGICTRKWWFSNPFFPQLTPGPRYRPRSSSETQDTTMVIEAEVPTEYYTAIRSEGAQNLILRLSSTACRQASNDVLPQPIHRL